MRLILIILFLFTPVVGQPISPSEVLEKIRSHYSQMNDASASFTQFVSMRYKKSGQQLNGIVKIKKGNKYCIETDQQTIVTNGKTVWMYSPHNKQVLVDLFRSNRQPFSPDKFLLGIPKDFSATSVEQRDEQVILSLQPTQKNTSMSNIVSLKIWTTSAEWNIEKIEMVDKNGSTTIIALSNIFFNKGIDDANFQFEVTKEMNVVDLTTVQ